jgi:superfamily I DNA/RNA helicase
MWMLPPFKKALDKRQNETVLLEQLGECIGQLFRHPTSSGLDLEQLRNTGRTPVFSARITKAFRLLLVELGKSEVGLLYFDHHDEAHSWLDRHRTAVPTMLTKLAEIDRATTVAMPFQRIPAVLPDEESPIAIASAEQFRRMVAEGVARYLTFLDEEQRRLVELNVSGLLLVKGGAGTGKTAVAIHRVLNLASQSLLPETGPSDVLYLCYNNVLAKVVRQLLTTLSNGSLPQNLEVKTFHAWCKDFLAGIGAPVPNIDDRACRETVFRAFGKLLPEQRVSLEKHDGRFVDDEIEHVIKHNGLTKLDDYLNFNRKGRRVSLKRGAREAIWAVYERSQQYQAEQHICRWCDLFLLTLSAIDGSSDPPQYRAVIIDEAQDCSPVMVRLAKRFVASANGSLTVFADPAQAIYECGFQWTQRELAPSGGNVRWLRRNYRTTREIFDLARPLLEGHEDLKEDLAQMEQPVRQGTRPNLIVARDETELCAELVNRVAFEVQNRVPNQIGVLAANRKDLERLAMALGEKGVPADLVQSKQGVAHLEDATVKLLTMQSVKGLDFPVVFVLAPHRNDLGGEARANQPETRRTFYVSLTRASERLAIGAVYDRHHSLLNDLSSQCYDVEGPCSREWTMMH